jgi:hypothetical protein
MFHKVHKQFLCSHALDNQTWIRRGYVGNITLLDGARGVAMSFSSKSLPSSSLRVKTKIPSSGSAMPHLISSMNMASSY